MSTPRRLPYGGPAENFLEAQALVYALGLDPEADTHWADLGRAIGAVCKACDNASRAHGLCDTHYRTHRRATRNEAHLINHSARKAAAS